MKGRTILTRAHTHKCIRSEKVIERFFIYLWYTTFYFVHIHKEMTFKCKTNSSSNFWSKKRRQKILCPLTSPSPPSQGVFLQPRVSFNPFVPNAFFLYPLKSSENLAVFWCFQGVEKGCIGNEWVKYMLATLQRHLS